MGFVKTLLSHKLLILFIVATVAFAIATIVLAVENADLKSQLDDENLEVTTTAPVTEKPVDMSKYRLPAVAAPTTYDLYLYPDLQTGLFKGKVSADTDITENTNSVVLHSNQLNINSVHIGEEEGVFEIDKDYELLSVRKRDGSNFEKDSKVKITVDFDGDMKNRIVGLYTSS